MLSNRNALASPLPILFHNAANGRSGRMIPDFPRERPLIPSPPMLIDRCILDDNQKTKLRCQLCQGLLREAMKVDSCGHTFCNECIQKAIASHVKDRVIWESEKSDKAEGGEEQEQALGEEEAASGRARAGRDGDEWALDPDGGPQFCCPSCKKPAAPESVVPARDIREEVCRVMVRCIYGVSYNVGTRTYEPVSTKCTEVFPLSQQNAHLQECGFVVVVCSFEEDGCEATLPRMQVASHEKECEFRAVDCPCEPFGCKHFGPGVYMQRHLETCSLYPALPILLSQQEEANGWRQRSADLQRQKSRLIEEHRQMEDTLAELLSIIEQTRSSMDKQLEAERMHAREMRRKMDSMAKHAEALARCITEKDRIYREQQLQLEHERKRRAHLLQQLSKETEKNQALKEKLRSRSKERAPMSVSGKGDSGGDAADAEPPLPTTPKGEADDVEGYGRPVRKPRGVLDIDPKSLEDEDSMASDLSGPMSPYVRTKKSEGGSSGDSSGDFSSGKEGEGPRGSQKSWITKNFTRRLFGA